MTQSLRFAARQLRRTPGFAAGTIFLLALGIGLSIAVFTVSDALLLRHLPVRDQNKLVVLWGESRNAGFDHFPFGLDDAHDFAKQARLLEQVAFVAYEGAWPKTFADGNQTFRFRRAVVSGRFFDVLGVQPVLGRTLRESDDVAGAAPVVVLSHAAWRTWFGGDPHVLGRRLLSYENAVTYTIIGVMPRGLDYPRGSEMWVPIAPSVPANSVAYIGLDAVGRLAPGATPATAREEVGAFLERAGGARFDLRGVVHTLPRLMLGDTRPALLVFSAAAALLLLITCTNVANLLLVRGLARTREIAVRSALGAARLRIAGQLLTENALLALAGGAVGVIVAVAAVRLFLALAPGDLPRIDEIGWSKGVFLGALGITGVATLLFGLVPAITTSRTDVQEVLRAGTRQAARRRSRRATELLVIGQVAMALVVLSAAGLIAKSLMKLERARLSFEPSRLLIGELALRRDRFDTRAKGFAVLDRLLPALEATPGVRAVSPVLATPFSGNGGWDVRLVASGQRPSASAAAPLNMEAITPRYFAALGIQVVRGRAFSDADREDAPPVVILSQSAAQHFWPNQDPVGKRVGFADTSSERMTVVGIVPDTRYRDLREERPSIYFPLRQLSWLPYAPMTLAIRTQGPPTALISTIRRVVGEVEPGVTVVKAAAFDDYLAKPLAQPRLDALLLSIFAGSATLLATAGLFGVMVTMVRQRRRELGVRMALGATPSEVLRLVLRRGMTLAALGTLLGVLGAVAANSALATVLYEVSPTDGSILSLVSILMLATGTLASLIPARSGSAIDPVAALRTE